MTIILPARRNVALDLVYPGKSSLKYIANYLPTYLPGHTSAYGITRYYFALVHVCLGEERLEYIAHSLVVPLFFLGYTSAHIMTPCSKQITLHI